VYRNGHGARRGGIGYFLAPLYPVANLDQAFIGGAKMLIDGDNYLLWRWRKLNGLPLGCVLPGGKKQSSLKSFYRH
jgi:hypothetical protein